MLVFHVRSIYPCEDRVDASTFELCPTNPQGEAVCSLFAEFMKDKPPEFRSRLTFLKKGDFEIDWSAVPGGVALVSMLQESQTASMGILVTGIKADTDSMMLDVFEENVLQPLFGDSYSDLRQIPDRPLLLQVIFAAGEWAPAHHLLGTALASVYFRSILHGEESACSG